MAGRRIALIAVVLSALGTSASGAAKPDPVEAGAGQSIHVVAVKTSSLRKFLVLDRFRSDLTVLSCGAVVKGSEHVERAGAGRSPLVSSESPTLERLAIGQTPLISTDAALKGEIEKAFRKQKKFKVAETLGGADLVLVAFAAYPIATSRVQGTKLLSAWRGYEDSSYSSKETFVFAFVLSASTYRDTGTGAQELSEAALWQGFNRITNANCNRSAQTDAATELVKRFHRAFWSKNNRHSQPNPVSSSDPGGAGQSPRQLKTAPDPAGQPWRTPTSSPDATVRVTSTAVSVPVSVSDRAGRHIPDLTQTDFRVFEDDIEQKIHHFRAVDTPFRVVLLLDSSASMRLKHEDLCRAATAFVDELRPQDRVMVVSFDSEVRLHAEFTDNRTLLQDAISRTRPGPGTRLYDALDLVLTERLNLVDGRKATVLFSDGVDTESRLADKQRVLDLAEESGALIYVIRYDTADDVVERPLRGRINGRVFDVRSNEPNAAKAGTDVYHSARRFLTELTRVTGALEYQADSLADLSQAFSTIATELGRQYELAYYPSNPVQDGSHRRITVQVNRSGATVRARPGYRSSF